MKIQKIALSIFAVAISSSAFAFAPSSDTQSISDQIKYAFLDGQSSYDIVTGVAAANIYAGARGSDSSDIEFTSAQKEFITKEIVLPIRTEVCAEAFRELRSGQSDVEGFNNLPAEASNLSVIALVAIKASSLLTSCSFINPDTHKIEVLGLQNDDAKNVWGYKAKIDNVGGITEFGKADIDNNLYHSFVKHLWGATDTEMLRQLQVNSNIRESAIELAAERKAKENAKEISEFNALQEIALKETDPAVRAAIKQAADLKLASYTK